MFGMNVSEEAINGKWRCHLAPEAFMKSPYSDDKPPNEAATVSVYKMKEVNVPVDMSPVELLDGVRSIKG